MKTMIELQEFLNAQKAEGRSTSIEVQAARDITHSSGESVIVDTVTDIAKDLSELFAFAYELRKSDPKNLYSYDFLNGQVNPQVVIDIIMNNTWDPKKKKMILSRDCEYRMVIPIGQKRFTLVYLKAKQSLSKQISVPFILNEGNAVPKNMTPNVKFTLCPKGLKIGRDDVQLATQTGQNELDQGQSAPIKIDYKHDDHPSSTWTLKRAGENAQDPFFFVEMPYGEMRPRLAYQKEKP